MSKVEGMSSNRPYMLRAMYDWISDNGMSPYLLVDARRPGVRVPPGVINNGQVVLNVAPRAVGALDLGNDFIRFEARFGGVPHRIEVPLRALLAVYARESGQGMMFPADDEAGDETVTGIAAGEGDDSSASSGETASTPRRGSHLKVVK